MIEDSERRTLGNSGLNLTFAFDYGGQEEIAAAARELARAAAEGRLDPETITPELLSSRLFTSGLPEPDLVIRTSGRAPAEQLPAVAIGLCGIDVRGYSVARFQPPGIPRRARQILAARAPLRRPAGIRGVSKSSDIAANPRPPLRSLRFSRDWITRPVFGMALALITIAAIYGGAPYLAVVVAAAAFFGAREWHRMIERGQACRRNSRRPRPRSGWRSARSSLWPSGIASYVVLALRHLPGAGAERDETQPSALAGSGRSLSSAFRRWRVVLLREIPVRGGWLIGLLFVVVWATDTAAFVIGNLIGGPKLAPDLVAEQDLVRHHRRRGNGGGSPQPSSSP